MKKPIYLLIFLSAFFLCGCKKDGGSGLFGKMEMDAEIQPASPVTEPSFEELTENVKCLISSACDSLDRMNEMASKPDAPAKGLRSAKKVNKKYAQRLAGLSETDLSSFSEKELYALSEELSHIITAIREARDLLNGI